MKDGEMEVLEDSACSEEKPESEKPCEQIPCSGVDWVASDWNGVSCNFFFFILFLCNWPFPKCGVAREKIRIQFSSVQFKATN